MRKAEAVLDKPEVGRGDYDDAGLYDRQRVPAAAKLMQCSEANIRLLLKQRKIKRFKFGNLTYVSMKELRSLIRAE